MKTVIRNLSIDSIASCVPSNILEMGSLESIYGDKEVSNIMKVTGVHRAHIVDNNTTAADLCFAAAEHLIEQEQINREEIDGIVFISQTRDYILPATSTILQHRLKLSKDTICVDIPYGCSGYIYGLLQAASWLSVNACNKVLLLSGDTSTSMINDLDRSMRMVFGDAGTATLLSRGDANIAFAIHSDGSGYDKLIIPAGGYRMPINESTSKEETDVDGNTRSLEDIYMDGMAIFDFAISNVHNNVNETLELMNWDVNSVGMFAFHQANKFMVNCIRKKLKVPIDKVPFNLENYGNTGPATIPLLLSDLCGNTDLDLTKVVMSGFGVGLSWGCAATDLSKTKLYSPIIR